MTCFICIHTKHYGSSSSLLNCSQAESPPHQELQAPDLLLCLISGQEASSGAAAKPDQIPGPGDVERLLNRLQRKDAFQIFKDPVTDAIVRAPKLALTIDKFLGQPFTCCPETQEE